MDKPTTWTHSDGPTNATDALMVGLVENYDEIWIPIFSCLITIVVAFVAIVAICCKCGTCRRRFKCCAQALPDDGSAGSTVIYQRADKFHTL